MTDNTTASPIVQLIGVLSDLTNVFKDMEITYAQGLIYNANGTRSFVQGSFNRMLLLKDLHLRLATFENVSDPVLKSIASKIMTTFSANISRSIYSKSRYTREETTTSDNHFIQYSVNNIYKGVPTSYAGAMNDIYLMSHFPDKFANTISDIQRVMGIATNMKYDTVLNPDTPRNVLLLQLATYVKAMYYNSRLDEIANNQDVLSKQLEETDKRLALCRPRRSQEQSSIYEMISDDISGKQLDVIDGEPVVYTQSEFVKMLQDVNKCLQSQASLIETLKSANIRLQEQVNQQHINHAKAIESLAQTRVNKQDVSDMVYDILTKEDILYEENEYDYDMLRARIFPFKAELLTTVNRQV